MPFEEAVRLAEAIRDRGRWYVLEISAQSGEKLEDDKWSVSALCTLNWSYFHYFARTGAVVEWSTYASAFEIAQTRRASSHEI